MEHARTTWSDDRLNEFERRIDKRITQVERRNDTRIDGIYSMIFWTMILVIWGLAIASIVVAAAHN